MSIRVVCDNPASSAALCARLDRLGVHDWSVAPTPWGALLDLTDSEAPSAGAARSLNAAALDDAALVRAVDALPRPALRCGHASYLKRALHTVNNALTPALIGVSMVKDMLKLPQADVTDLAADMDTALLALGAVQARLKPAIALADGQMTAIDPRPAVGHFERRDSALRVATFSPLVFDVSAAPPTRLRPAQLESWLLTAAEALGRDADSTLTVHLGASEADAARARLRVAAARAHTPDRVPPPLFTVQRAALAQGARVELTPRSLEIVLPAVQPPPPASGRRALVAIARPGLRARVNGALLAAGYLTSEVARFAQAQARFQRYGAPAVMILDARASAAWGVDAPPHIVVAGLASIPARAVSKGARWLSAFASPAAIQQAAAR